MRVLVVHNHYLQAGGEDTVVQAEKALLEANGNEVFLFEDTNQELAGASVLTKVKVALNAIYSPSSRRRMWCLCCWCRSYALMRAGAGARPMCWGSARSRGPFQFWPGR